MIWKVQEKSAVFRVFQYKNGRKKCNIDANYKPSSAFFKFRLLLRRRCLSTVEPSKKIFTSECTCFIWQLAHYFGLLTVAFVIDGSFAASQLHLSSGTIRYSYRTSGSKSRRFRRCEVTYCKCKITVKVPICFLII